MTALASQSLAIMISLIPYVRETFRRHLSPKQAVMLIEFDKLKRDYQEHQNEIHAKLVAIMGDRLNTHIASLQVRARVGPRGQVLTGVCRLCAGTCRSRGRVRTSTWRCSCARR